MKKSIQKVLVVLLAVVMSVTFLVRGAMLRQVCQQQMILMNLMHGVRH